MSSAQRKTPAAKASRAARAKRYHKARMLRDPAYRKKRHKREGLRKNYGITLADYDLLREVQDNKCGICGVEPAVGEKELAVDHNHATRYIRGLLCFHCNVGIGHFQDSVPLLLKAIAWLTERNG